MALFRIRAPNVQMIRTKTILAPNNSVYDDDKKRQANKQTKGGQGDRLQERWAFLAYCHSSRG